MTTPPQKNPQKTDTSPHKLIAFHIKKTWSPASAGAKKSHDVPGVRWAVLMVEKKPAIQMSGVNENNGGLSGTSTVTRWGFPVFADWCYDLKQTQWVTRRDLGIVRFLWNEGYWSLGCIPIRFSICSIQNLTYNWCLRWTVVQGGNGALIVGFAVWIYTAIKRLIKCPVSLFPGNGAK